MNNTNLCGQKMLINEPYKLIIKNIVEIFFRHLNQQSEINVNNYVKKIL